ncbi:MULTISPECIES: lipopolysaccharide assembly protein LapA domain-containing protein [unclassified Bradyrhizobium]|uniref:lipopolysaccharide assembly protein LapA domain-containing protein n=1 Tax=unclassified Bradyrhizobium TaxID=2631580 RepID=UPI0028E65BA9|nr:MULTISPECIES: lipopolysaccharide assembly protein LapA domain-containing protein [unclassified Bradyrhizobium]
MRKFFTVVVVLPLLVLFVIFAVANRHFVTVSFDPFNATDPALSASVPLFALIIAVAILGVIAGGCATWIGQRRWRRAARRHQADAEAARAQVAQLSAAARAKQGSAQSLVPAAPARLFAPYGRDKQGVAL